MARSARRPGRQAQIARLLVVALAAAAPLLACASVGTPPGGPPDKEPPKIVAVKPESGAVVPDFHGDAAIQFNEVVEEMAGGGGAGSISGLEKQGLLSPVAGPVKVSWHRSRVTIKPKEGWKRRGLPPPKPPRLFHPRPQRSGPRQNGPFSTRPPNGAT